jgi:hypothetical protein
LIARVDRGLEQLLDLPPGYRPIVDTQDRAARHNDRDDVQVLSACGFTDMNEEMNA